MRILKRIEQKTAIHRRVIRIKVNGVTYMVTVTDKYKGHPQNTRTTSHVFTMANGVPYWPNLNVPPADCIREYHMDEIPGFDLEATNRTRDEQNEKFAAEYRARRAQTGYSAEERFEMRNELGPDVVDVITGKKIKL